MANEVRGLERSDDEQYDFVIQDCFTGGSVPHELFTQEFWEDIRMITKADGVIAVVSGSIMVAHEAHVLSMVHAELCRSNNK
jgi:spermidine synthase